MLGTLDNTGNLVWFISSAAVFTAIEDVATGGSSQVIALANKVSGLSATTIEIESNLASVSAATKPMLTAVTMNAPTTGAVTGNYIQYTTEITGSDYEKVESVDTKLDVIQTALALSGVSATGQVADALAIRTYVEGVNSNIQGQINNATTKIGNLSSSTVALEEEVDYALSGLTINSGNSIKTYVDSKISQAVSSAYVVKGTKATYSQLSGVTDAVAGDVWNVTEAGTSASTPDGKYHSEGTNWVWTGSEWDALGGTVDLTNYVTTDVFTPTQDKANTALQSISGYSTNDYITLTNVGASHTSAFTVTENVATSFGSIQSTEKKTADAYAIQEYAKTLKNEAVTSAYTAASALTWASETGIVSQINDLDERVDTISASNVYNSAVTAVTFDALTNVSYTPEGQAGHTEAMEHQSGAAATVTGNTLKLDLDTLVIDCGTF